MDQFCYIEIACYDSHSSQYQFSEMIFWKKIMGNTDALYENDTVQT